MPEDTRDQGFDLEDDYPWDPDLNVPEYEEDDE